MVKLFIRRRATRGSHFVEYALTVAIASKEYDLSIDFLIWAEISPNEKTTFSLRPEANPGTFKGPRAPVYKEEVLPGMFREIWKEEIKDIKHSIDTISFPLNVKDNHELFTYCLNDPVRFSDVYQGRLKELKAYSVRNDQEILSAPKWAEIDSKSLVPVAEVPQEADAFFLQVFKLRLMDAGHEIRD